MSRSLQISSEVQSESQRQVEELGACEVTAPEAQGQGRAPEVALDGLGHVCQHGPHSAA